MLSIFLVFLDFLAYSAPILSIFQDPGPCPPLAGVPARLLAAARHLRGDAGAGGGGRRLVGAGREDLGRAGQWTCLQWGF